jgi:hypothetical protein
MSNFLVPSVSKAEVVASIYATSIKDLATADTSAPVTVQRYYASYAEADLGTPIDGSSKGGGLFVWDPNLPKSRHDGGIFISPTVPYNGTRAGLANFLAKVGETNSGGNGVWVRKFEGHIMADWFGCMGNRVADDQPSIQKALDVAYALNRSEAVGLENVGKTRTVEITGTCLVKRYLTIGSSITLYGQSNGLTYSSQDSSFRNDINFLGGATIYAHEDCVLYNARNQGDNCVIFMEADASRIDGIVVDGYDLDFGTWFPVLRCRDANNVGAANSAHVMLRVIDPSDARQDGNLRINSEQVPAFQFSDAWHPGFQLDALGGNRTGAGTATGTYTSISASAPYQWDVISGTLPSGIAVSKSGWVTCTSPSATGKAFVRVRVADADGATAEKDFSFEVRGKYINPEPKGLPTATINMAYYNFACKLVNATDTAVAHRWWLVGGPAGLTINASTGVISGTPAAGSFGKYKMKVAITTDVSSTNYDANILVDSVEYDFTVENTSYPSLWDGAFGTTIVNQSFTGVLRPVGGVGPFTWALDTGATLPAGLALTTDGVNGIVSGTPTAAGYYEFKIIGSDSTGKLFSGTASVEVLAAAKAQLKMARNWNLPVAVKGQAYSYQLGATQANCTFSTAPKGLPTGLSLSTSGLISGTPVGGRAANGISLSWSCKIANVLVRNFKNGSGIIINGPCNVNVLENIFSALCDIGINSRSWYDSRMRSFYIYGCRIGMYMRGGTAANTYMDGRIEYIHEEGVSTLFSNDNLFNSVYWDTCGYAAISANDCNHWSITNCIFFRSGRRVPPRGKHYTPDSYDQWSSHLNLLRCKNFAIGQNSFIRGSESEGSSNPLRSYTIPAQEWVRPSKCITVEDCKEIVVSGNDLTGCTRESVSPKTNEFEFYENDLVLEGNVVQTIDAFSTVTAAQKEVKNLFTNASKSNFTSEGNDESTDPSWANVSLLLDGSAFTDRSPRAYTLNNTNVTINNSIYRFGTGSMSFNGTSSLLTPSVADNASNTAGFYFGNEPWTVELQVYPLRNNVAQTLLDFGVASETGPFAIAMDANGKLILAKNRSTGGQTVDFTSTTTIPINTWTRIIICKTGQSDNDVRIYINEALEGTLSTAFDSRFIISGFNRPILGRGGFTGATDFFQGYMQEVRVTKVTSRYGTASTIPQQTKPYPTADYGSVPANSLIYTPKAAAAEYYWGDRSYSLTLGATASISKFVRISRRTRSDLIADVRTGEGSYYSGVVNPSDYSYKIVKAAETGTTPGTYVYQQCELKLWIARIGNAREFDALRGKRIDFLFYARSKNQNKLTVFNQFYAGTSDNAFRVDGGFYTEFTMKPYWRRYRFVVDVPEYPLSRIDAAACNMYMRFNMDDKSQSYDWDLGGVMVYPSDGRFGFVQFSE